ncbi:hypothetical protein MGAD_03950 [Mycolicibacterium gadium]|uniref:Uncharacterized protein n=1 Tax=Mycolicibacterium gadium TaxID=1794 RepID=A0A7I7WG41_MYCGU|nr:hypothetical protein MGAD_03950 [Mycolicibacterium gadium]
MILRITKRLNSITLVALLVGVAFASVPTAAAAFDNEAYWKCMHEIPGPWDHRNDYCCLIQGGDIVIGALNGCRAPQSVSNPGQTNPSTKPRVPGAPGPITAPPMENPGQPTDPAEPATIPVPERS